MARSCQDQDGYRAEDMDKDSQRDKIRNPGPHSEVLQSRGGKFLPEVMKLKG